MRIISKFLVFIALLIAPCIVFSAETGNASGAGSSSLEVRLNPGFTIPLGESGDVFDFGSGNMMSLGYVLGFSPAYFLGIELGYNFTPLVEESTISLLSGGLRFASSFRLLPMLEAGIYIGGGYFYGFLNEPYEYAGITYNPKGGNPYFCGGLNLGWYFSRELSLGIEAVYRNYLGFSHDVSAGIGIAYHVSFKAIDALEQQSIHTDVLFPALMQEHYGTTPLGKIIFKNKAEQAVENVRVSFFISGFMDGPAELQGTEKIEAGKSFEISIIGLFNAKTADFIKDRELPAEIVAEYMYEGQMASQKFNVRIQAHKVTDYSWANPEYAAAFVTPKAESIANIANLATENVKEKANKEIPINLQLAICIQNAVSAQKVAFRQDAKSPYKDYSANPSLVDSIQFPETTLEKLGGDSDELALLYSSLFEAAGIETALIQVPGQMLFAFSPGIKESDISLKFFHADKLVARDGKMWLPFDPTEQTGSFINAVTLGSDKWVKSKTEARLFPVRATQDRIKSLASPGSASPPQLPDKAELASLFDKSIEAFITWEMESKAAEVRKEIQKSGSSSVLMNRLGVLYGRYGLYDKALEIFSQVILKDEYVPSLVNIGNIYYKENELNKALPFYDRAYKQAPLDVYTLLGLAKINHKLENYGNARDAYNKLKSIDPALAARYSYLELKGDEARLTAKLSEEKEEVVWIVE